MKALANESQGSRDGALVAGRRRHGRDARTDITTLGAENPPESAPSLATPDSAAVTPALAFQKYRPIARLGKGGMAEVFLAVPDNPQRAPSDLLVLKILKTDLSPAERAEFARMFADEGKLATRLRHPNVVRSFDVGSEGASSFIAMEYLDGQPLCAIQERGWKSVPGISLEMQLSVMCQLLEGLEYLHGFTTDEGRRLNIVHRDVSPQNVFVTYSGQTKLMDFGIAKTLESNTKTAAGVIKGKVRYMAPEQVRSRSLDHRADLFSVGVMLWEAIARRSMHGKASLYEIAGRLNSGDLPPIAAVVPDIDQELDRVVTRALSFDRDERYESAGVLRDELLAYLDTRRRVRSRELGERVERLFETEHRMIREVIWQAMNDESSAGPPARENIDPRLTELPCVSAPTERARGTDGRVTVPAQRSRHAASAPSDPPACDPPLAEPVASAETRGIEEGLVMSSTSRSGARSKGGIVLGRARRPTVLWLAAAGIGVAALAVGIDTPRTASTRGQIMVVESAPARRVRLDLRATPPSARFFLDGQALPGNPYLGERTADSNPHTLDVIADRHEPKSFQVRLNGDLVLGLDLPPVGHRSAGDEVAAPAPGGSDAREPAGLASAPTPRSGLKRPAPLQPQGAPPGFPASEAHRAAAPSSGTPSTHRRSEPVDAPHDGQRHSRRPAKLPPNPY